MSNSPSRIWRSPFKVIVFAGLLAGLLDILAALLVYSVIMRTVPAILLLQSIASGIFGTSAYKGGWTMALLGVIFHFGLTFCFTIFYFLLYSYSSFLRKHHVISGILYGLFIWIVMNLGVLPLVLARTAPVTPGAFLIGALILITMIGFPLAFIARKYDMRTHWENNERRVG
jgi:uncharacterized membrane protein YagU involved in acid resistance